MKIKAGIAVDNYKIEKYSTVLTDKGYSFTISPFTRSTSLFSIEAESFVVKEIYAICAELEKQFKADKK